MRNFLSGLWSTKKEESKPQEPTTQPVPVDDYRAKYKKAKARLLKLENEYLVVAEAAKTLLQDQSVTRFLLFSIAVQCGSSLELSSESIEIAEKLYETHDLDFVEEKGNLIYRVKRRETPLKKEIDE